MSYKVPCLKDLRAIADELRKYSDTNSKRLSFIALYDQLVGQTAETTMIPENIINVLVGALVFEMADIKFGEYNGKSPKKRTSWFLWTVGSDLYTLIKSKLNITKENRFGYDERLFYINEYFKYMEKVYPEDGIEELKQHKKLKDNHKSPSWKTKKELTDHIHTRVNTVLQRNDDVLYALVHGVPILNALLKNLQKLEDEYCQNSSNPKNPKRLETINFIKFVIKSYDGINPEAVSWHACVGVVIIALMRIEKEYRILSPARSTLFKEALHAINQTSLESISIDDRIKCTRSLSAHLTTISENKKYYEATLHKVIEASPNQKLTTDKLDEQMKQFQSRIDRYLFEMDEEKKNPSKTRYAISTGTSYFVQYLGGPVGVKIGKQALLGGLSIGAYLLGGPLVAVFGVGGKLLFSGLGGLVAEGILDSWSASLFAWLLEKTGNRVGDATAAVITYPFSATPKGIEEMRMKLKPEDDLVFVNMVNTMLEVDLISESDKEKMRNVLGIEKDARLQPLKITVEATAEEKKHQDNVMVYGYGCKTLDSSTGALKVVPPVENNVPQQPVVRTFF